MVEEQLECRLRNIEELIRAAQARSPRAVSGDVRLLAVSKRQPPERVESLLNIYERQGRMPSLGENYVQELGRRRAEFGDRCRFHLIGRLQKNKVRDAVAFADVIESVDSVELAGLLDREAGKQRKVVDVFVEVNVSGDERKAGFDLAGASDFITGIAPTLRNIRVKGLMTITMLYGNPEDVRGDYARLRELRDGLVLRSNGSALELSMGMSDDFEIAVEEGATEVRVGTALFGMRE